MSGDFCKLCKKEAKLCNSHILPEFLYLDLYEEHKILQITKENEKVLQKGIREYLLCQKCETKLSKYEKYAKELIHEIPNFPRDDSLGVLHSDNVDYLKFKLFQLSMLWRASISTDKAFIQVQLGPHEEKIQQMLDEENPGEVSDYGCLMSIILETELLHKVLQSPTRFEKKFFGHTAYKFPIGNLTWVFVVSSHKVPLHMQELFLQKTGILRVMLSRRDEQSEILKIAQTLQSMGKGK